MADKSIIVHVIDSLGRGGAETLLVNLLPELGHQYDIILVTLTPESDFEDSEIICKKRYCLNYKGAFTLPSCILRLRKIIKQHQPILVRAQLYTSSLIARLATPGNIPMVFSIHTFQGIENYTKNRLSLPVEKLTYHKRHHLIGVSQQTIDDFDKYVGIKGPTYKLYNFINPIYFEQNLSTKKLDLSNITIVAVGNLKEVKNYGYLIKAFSKLKDYPISLDIYGEGPLRDELQKDIDHAGVKVHLKGLHDAIYQVLPSYDLFVMSSLYEGFGIAPVEAMASGLPLLLSNLPVLQEVTHNNALFFDQLNVDSFVKQVKAIFRGEVDLFALSEKGVELAYRHYRRDDYVHKLNSIYRQVIAG